MAPALGDFIGGRFMAPEGQQIASTNPARDGEVVLETAWSLSRVDLACDVAARAQRSWGALSLTERTRALLALKDALKNRAEALAEAIRLETGKIQSEAQAEVATVLARFDMVFKQVDQDFQGGWLPGFPNERLVHHPLGVVGVIGPFNFPVHLCHAYIVPALLMGNSVVVKPSETTMLCAQQYFEAVEDAGLPAGVLNLVQGTGEVGAALVENQHVRGICFTGSYEVGRRIRTASLKRPELLVALEMGGKNTALVLKDADLRQAVHELVLGAYLTTGQRCTATSRVLVERPIRARLLDALADILPKLKFGDPTDPASFA
ncbi:MAG: aldehyde dehydrogenase family protein, partial [Myxococcales bacterium]|nr:aldehyde dehydrogenase family protein [Myxococcales bacterium]